VIPYRENTKSCRVFNSSRTSTITQVVPVRRAAHVANHKFILNYRVSVDWLLVDLEVYAVWTYENWFLEVLLELLSKVGRWGNDGVGSPGERFVLVLEGVGDCDRWVVLGHFPEVVIHIIKNTLTLFLKIKHYLKRLVALVVGTTKDNNVWPFKIFISPCSTHRDLADDMTSL
jgi:hypothetical protein